MGARTYNPLREARLEQTEKWLRDHNCGSPVWSKMNCPKCGLKMQYSELTEEYRSQYYDCLLCSVCKDDEMNRERKGLKQIPYEEWAINSHGERWAW